MQQPVTIQLDIADHLDDFRRGMDAIPRRTEAVAVTLAEQLKREFLEALLRRLGAVKSASEAEIECGNAKP